MDEWAEFARDMMSTICLIHVEACGDRTNHSHRDYLSRVGRKRVFFPGIYGVDIGKVPNNPLVEEYSDRFV